MARVVKLLRVISEVEDEEYAGTRFIPFWLNPDKMYAIYDADALSVAYTECRTRARVQSQMGRELQGYNLKFSVLYLNDARRISVVGSADVVAAKINAV